MCVGELKLEPQAFKAVLSENIVLINKALQNSFVIADFEGFSEDIANIYEKVYNQCLFSSAYSYFLNCRPIYKQDRQ